LPKNSVFIDKKAQRQLEKLPCKVHDRINDAITVLLEEGLSKSLDIKKLQGLGKSYRIRVGKYRILFELSGGDSFIIYAILPRETAYKT
jgi:mRNA interferase RelE/StbE